ncbi:MAG: hypothetical protein AVDCRST_MAG89-4516, partial [uncultured Gemmatimonadetes bacterium]
CCALHPPARGDPGTTMSPSPAAAGTGSLAGARPSSARARRGACLSRSVPRGDGSPNGEIGRPGEAYRRVRALPRGGPLSRSGRTRDAPHSWSLSMNG